MGGVSCWDAWIKIKNPKYFAGGGTGRAVQSNQDGAEIACGDFEKLSVID
jgi:hypothetical protein